MSAQACAAGGGRPCCAGGKEGADQALPLGLDRDLMRRGRDDQPHSGRDLAPVQDSRRAPQVGDAGVGAGADEDLIEPGPGDLGKRRVIVRRHRPGDTELDFLHVELEDLLVLRVGVGSDWSVWPLGAPVQVLLRHLVELHDPVLGAGFDRHVGHRQARLHIDVAQCLARVLHRLRPRSVDPDLADDVEDQVLRLDPFLEPVVIDELERLGDAEPQLTQREHARQVGRPDARREVVQRAVGAGVRVRADDKLARKHESVLR